MIKTGYLATLGILTCLGSLLGGQVQTAHAEGSQDLISSGGDRPYLEFRSDLNGGIPRRTIVKVYANAGETISFGSSAVGIGNGVINYRTPNNTAGSCGASGLIANRAQEVAGPGNGSGGTFVPCTVTVGPGQSGVWEVDFVSPDTNSGINPPPLAGTAAWTQSATTGVISAWDVTVRSSGGAKIPGRVYANYYAFNIGNNNRQISSKLFVLTQEGYRYSIDLNGLDPFGFIFFANRTSFFNQNTGRPLFRSLQFTGANPGQLPPNYFLHNPNLPDNGPYVTHKIFINTPDAAMPSSASSPTGLTWLYNQPVPPPLPGNFKFTGIEGTNGQAGTSPLGGSLTFDSSLQTSYSITIDLSGDGVYGNGNDRTFLGQAVVGANSVFWDGRDGNDNTVAPNIIPYGVRVNLYAGEAHFPMIDVERNPNGIIVQRQNQPPGLTSAADHPDNVYYDDRNTGIDYTVCSDGETNTSAGVANPTCYGIGPTPRAALTGIISTTGAHAFTHVGTAVAQGFGDRRGMDTWVYFPSGDVNLAGGILLKQADLIINKTVDLATASAGNTLTYTITVTNGGPSDSPGITLQDTIPASLNNVNWTCSITSGTGSCGAASGSGNNINTTLSLNNQAVATYIVTASVSGSASGSVTNTGTVVRNKDITDPNLANNTDDATTVINATPPSGGTICYAVADSNDRLVRIDISSGTETNVGPLGSAPDVEAIAYWPITNTLYAADAGRLGTINTTTGAYTNIGTIGSGNGSAGNKTFGDVDGLAFNPYTGELYGSVRDGGNDGTPQDLLIKINPTTGARIANAFGAGVDYLVIATAATTTFNDVDDLAFDPETGLLYGIANQGSGSADRYVRINTTTGATTAIGPFGVTDLEGLTAFNDGSFYATTGNDSTTASQRNRFYRVNKTTGQVTFISQLTVGTDYEAIDCLTGSPNRITGTVFLDPDTSGTLNAGDSGTVNAQVRLYRDVNGNGLVDGGDVLILPQNSASNGTYDFLFAASGSFVLDVNPSTLPPSSSTFTTDNLEAAAFGNSLGQTDANNNFGHFTNANLAIVKRITAINGTRLTTSVDDTTIFDNHPNWPSGTSGAGISTFLAGATQSNIEPGDVVEYTIYYLATGNAPVTNVNLCDRVPTGTTYIPNSMILFTSGNTSTLSDTNTDGDGAQFLPINNNTAVPCPGVNSNGTLLVNLAPSPIQLPNATSPGTPTNAYGFLRFRATVN
jgi:uncharacterized repeat protein (TIGR01451 family)